MRMVKRRERRAPATGHLLDELKDEITRETRARLVRECWARLKALAGVLSPGTSFQPIIDYVVTNPALRGALCLRDIPAR